MGMGQIGLHCAEGLRELGFDVRGWGRTPRAGGAGAGGAVAVMSGREGLAPFLRDLAILVCLLPLTGETRGILNQKTFSLLARGAYLIHVARGPHLVEDDLIAALDSGQLSGATIDVFAHEPLPSEHRFWRDPRLILTPHVSALTRPQTAAPRLAENIRRDLAGEPLLDVVDRARGY